MLPCVPLLLCPNKGSPVADGLRPSDVLGLLSKGPGAIASILFKTLNPPSMRGLTGANSGLGAAYRC